MSTKLLVDCLDLYSFPTLDENCLYNPLQNHTALVNLEVLSSMRQLGCSNKLFKAFSTRFLTSSQAF